MPVQVAKEIPEDIMDISSERTGEWIFNVPVRVAFLQERMSEESRPSTS